MPAVKITQTLTLLFLISLSLFSQERNIIYRGKVFDIIVDELEYFAERESGVMKLRRGFEIKSGERVLVCEDVVTTGGSDFEVIELVKTAGGKFIGVGCIVDRSGGKIDFGTRFASVIKLEVPTFKSKKYDFSLRVRFSEICPKI